MSQPIIGITTYNGQTKEELPAVILLRAYVEAIMQAGGVPVLIPSELGEGDWMDLYVRLDGILFSGGGDIDVGRFNGLPHPCVEGVDEARDALEFGLLHFAIEHGKPIFGICRGSQVFNVGLGGTLYTHLDDDNPTLLKHDYFPDYPRNRLSHPVRLGEGSCLAEIMGESLLQVNSLHHQGIKDLAPTLKPVAHAPDGLIEAVEVGDHPFGLAVQWHPEWLTDQQPTRNLFRAFVDSARKYRQLQI